MASSIFLIAETQLFVETVERIGKELDCTVHVAHSPAEAMLPPSGNIDLIAFEPTKEPDKGFALLDILRLRYELPQQKVVIFGGMPEVQNATAIPLPLDFDAFSNTLRALLGRDPSEQKPTAASGKSAQSFSQGSRVQISKATVEQPLKLTEPLKLTQAVKPAPKGSSVEKGTQVVRATDVVQEIQLAQDAQKEKESPDKTIPSKPALKEAPKSVQLGKGADTPRVAKPATKVPPAAKAVPKDPTSPMPAKASTAAPREKTKIRAAPAASAASTHAAPSATKKQPAKPLDEKQPTPFESTPSWLRTALGLPPSQKPTSQPRAVDVSPVEPPPGPEHSLEHGPKHSLEHDPKHSTETKNTEHGPKHSTEPKNAEPGPKHSLETKNTEPGPKHSAVTKTPEPRAKPAPAVLPPSQAPSDVGTSDSTPGWLKSALGVSSPSAVLKSEQASPIDNTQSPTSNPLTEAEGPLANTAQPTQVPTDAKRDEIPADFEPSVLSPDATPSGDPSPDWLAKALGIDSSDSSVAPAGELSTLGEGTIAPNAPEPPSVHEAEQREPVQAAIPAVAPPSEAAVAVPPAVAPVSVVHPPVPVAPAMVPEAQPSPPKLPPQQSAAPSEPHHEAPPPPAKSRATPPPETAVEDHTSRRAAVEAELKATRNMLMEERTSRIRISKELEQLRATHTKEIEERRAEQELARAGLAERDAKAAQLLEEQTAKVAELTALHASAQEALANQEIGRNELQASQNKLQASHERELSALRESHERAMTELAEAHERAFAELQQSHQHAVADLAETQKQSLAELQQSNQELQDTHERAIAELQGNQQRQFLELQEQQHHELNRLRTEIATLKEALEAKELAHTIEVQTVAELQARIAELTREHDESKTYKEKLEAALAAESLRADEIAGRLVEAEARKARNRRLADIPRSGKLTLSELATLAGQLVELQANVRLELASPTATRSLWLTNGTLSASTSDNEHLITLARRDELIGENQERELAALRMARPNEQREALVARGFLSPEVAAALVARWTAHVAEAAFAESSTTYRLLEETGKKQTPEFSIPLLPLVRTALRRARPWESAVAEFAYAVLVPVPRELELSQASFSPEECALIESAAATSTADELIAASGLNREQAYACLLAAYYLDFLRIDSYRDPPPPADPEVGMQRLQAKYDQVQEADYFAILGLPRTAGPEEVRRAYELLSNEFHPLRFSTHQDPAVQERAAAVWSSITEAAEALGDDRLRVEYAQHLID